jgi:hypothetical protein
MVVVVSVAVVLVYVAEVDVWVSVVLVTVTVVAVMVVVVEVVTDDVLVVDVMVVVVNDEVVVVDVCVTVVVGVVVTVEVGVDVAVDVCEVVGVETWQFWKPPLKCSLIIALRMPAASWHFALELKTISFPEQVISKTNSFHRPEYPNMASGIEVWACQTVQPRSRQATITCRHLKKLIFIAWVRANTISYTGHYAMGAVTIRWATS